MSFVLSKLLWLVLSPSALLLFLAAAGLLLVRRGRLRLGRGLLLFGLGAIIAIAVLPIGNFAAMPLEDRFAQPSPMPAHVDGVIVLGGAVETALTEDRGLPSLNGAAERMTAALVLARRYPQARIAFTGGSGSLAWEAISEADVARALWSEMGLPAARTVFEALSRNTYENAVFLKAIVHPQPGETWLLVTSAAHMPRAVGIFRRVGWDVVPYPVGYKTGRGWRVWSHPSLGEHLDLLDNAAHEYAGLAAYRLLGRTDALFPGPAAPPQPGTPRPAASLRPRTRRAASPRPRRSASSRSASAPRGRPARTQSTSREAA